MRQDILYPFRVLHGRLHQVKIRYDMRRRYKKEFYKNPNTVFLVMTPEHGNLGDHAIAFAEKSLLNTFGINCIEIVSKQLDEMIWGNLVGAMNGFPILITGGGNLGTLWMNVELAERAVIAKNPKSPIYILPNTILYEDSQWGRDEFEKSRKLYNCHKKLCLYAREQISYEVMRSAYRNVKLIPDMVLLLEQQGVKQERKGCLLCLRGDCEKTRTEEQEQIIRQQASELFGTNVSDTDMVVKGNVIVEQREAALLTKFDEFSGAELVITDRLHGMIFCAITGTPCIVVDSKSPKVRGCYEWIKNLDYIRLADDVAQIASEYRKIPKTEHEYDNSHLRHYYEELAKDILSML